MITISLAQRADIINLANREVANSGAALSLYSCVSLHNNYQIEDVLSYIVDEKN